jgi:transposase
VPSDAPLRGHTPRDVAHLLRVGRSRVLTWIRSGELQAINTAPTRCGKPRFVVLPQQLAEFLRSHQATAPKSAPRRNRRTVLVDYFPD